MIVIALIGILGLVGISTFRGYWDNTNLRTAAREVMSDIAFAKQRAVSESLQYCIQFTDGSANYSINATSCAAPTATQNKNLANFGAGITASTSFNSDRVAFLPRGTLSTNTGIVTLTNTRGSTAAITINITGRTYVSFQIQ